MNWILDQKNISVENSQKAIQFTYSASNQFKANFEDYAEKGILEIYWASFYLTQILIGCKFQGIKCGPQDFFWYHDYYYGNCFRFNGGDQDNQTMADFEFKSYDIKKVSKIGWRNGLQLEMFAGAPGYQQQYTPKIGFRIIVHNQSIIPFPDEDGVDAPTGFETNVAISRTFMRRLPDPYSNCITEVTEKEASKNEILMEMFWQKQNGKIFQYQANYCQKICYQYFIIKECSCYSLSLNFMNLEKTRNENITGCLSFGEVKCSEDAEKRFYNGDESKKCYALCPEECNKAAYELSATMARYPHKWFFDYYQENFLNTESRKRSSGWGLFNNPNSEAARSSATIVNIFYDSLTYQVLEEKGKFSLDMAISGMGGNIALFTGMSILSVVEFMEITLSCFLILVVYRFFKCERKKKQT